MAMLHALEDLLNRKPNLVFSWRWVVDNAQISPSLEMQIYG